MSLMPFSSRSSSRSSGGGDAGGEKKLSNRKYTISLSFSGLITSGIITIIAIGWIFAFGVIVGRGYNPEKKMPELARLLPPPEGQDAPKEAKGILKPEELTFMTDLKQTQPAANAAPNKPEAKAAHPTAQPVAAATPKTEAPSARLLRIRPNTTSSFRLWRTRAKTVPTNCANAWKAKGCALV